MAKVKILAALQKSVLLFLFATLFLHAQTQEKKRVDIIHADYLESDERIAANAQRLVGNVHIQHKNILMWADSAYTYTGTNKVDAFGNVHIRQGDTLDLYAGKIFYNGDISFAQAIKNVKLINKDLTLYTDTLDYDMENNVGYYDSFGKIVDSTNVLTSIIGKYFVDKDVVHFYRDVKGSSPDYNLESDTLYYNTQTGQVTIVGPTTIRDSASTLYAEAGWYETKTGEAELQKNPLVYNETQQLKADFITYNKENTNGRALGNVFLHDFENKMLVTGHKADYNEFTQNATVTDSALLAMYNEKDTLFLHADTLRTVPDTIEGEKLVKAFYGVRFFREDLQGISDSLVYFTRDSVVQLYYNPVIWSDIHQLSAENIEMKQKNDAPDEVHLNSGSFIISQQDSGKFDQIKGRNMIGYVVNNELQQIDVDGNGQTLYYAREDSAIIGLNRAESSKISIRFKDGQIHRISFIKAPTGKLKPLFEITEEEKKLSGFDWKVALRPKSKYDVFSADGQEPERVRQKPLLPVPLTLPEEIMPLE